MTRFPFSLYIFSSKNDLNFCQTQYSQLKYGSDIAARKFGKDLADKFFEQHYDKLLSNNCVVIPSPYNHVQNAASVLTKHFVNQLNQLLVGVNGNVVETTIIHRKVNYTMDYGFLQQDQREHLINNDAFYFNEQFINDKFLIFVDDIKITGAHERRMIRLLNDTNSQNDCAFVYIANYDGVDPTIEAFLNLNGVNNCEDFLKIVREGQRHVIVRAIKWLLSRPLNQLTFLLKDIQAIDIDYIEELYYGCLGEGYHKIPSYQPQFQIVADFLA